jgi:quinol-cytochrome oxidoreductase complex cytochrome b subunit/mono/diheme cytochrome c family protein
MNAFLAWLDHRTGIRDLMHSALYEHIPGGARWRYVWGSTLVFAFTVQAVTGIFLWMCYSPSSQTAWESVAYIQYEMQGGWLLRGLHHFMAQAMVVLLALHLMQVVIDGAYRAPREVNFWLGLVLMQIVLGLSLTGYLLPWDQKGYWATRVATNLMGLVPYVGTDLQQLVVGGPDYGHHTLTRFFALHAGVLPALLVGFLVLHIAIFRRHGIHVTNPRRRPDTTFWPDQVLRDAVACLAVLAVVLFFIFKPAILGQAVGDRPGEMLGADLGAPADPANQYAAARPEWYFLFLFQFLKFFPGDQEIVGALIIPGVVMLALFMMPLVGRWKLGHGFNVGLLGALLVGIGLLTVQAWYHDNMLAVQDNRIVKTLEPALHLGIGDPDEQRKESKAYLTAVEGAEANAKRAIALASGPQGIPPGGAVSLMRTDPKTQGPILFQLHCATCHDHVDSSGHGIAAKESSAPNLYGFASRAWLTGLLDPKQIAGPHYFGKTSHKAGDMVTFVKEDLPKHKAEDLPKVIAALSAEAGLKSQQSLDAQDAKTIAAGKKLIAEFTCTDCHKFYDAGEEGNAPELTGYGSNQWLKGMISHANDAHYYGEKNDRMPLFAEHTEPERNIIRPADLDLLVRWLRGDWYEPAEAKAE